MALLFQYFRLGLPILWHQFLYFLVDLWNRFLPQYLFGLESLVVLLFLLNQENLLSLYFRLGLEFLKFLEGLLNLYALVDLLIQ